MTFRRVCLTLFLMLCVAGPVPAQAGPIQAKGAILYDFDRRKILYEQNADRQVPPASLTKILSMYVTLDTIRAKKATVRDRVTVSRRAASTGGSRMGLRAGEKVSLYTLLLGMAVSSGNDASAAVAEHIAGSESAFIRRMNSTAKKLGMSKSRFASVHGLPAKGQLTTARDMLHLARNYLAVFPDVLRYHSLRFMSHRGHRTSSKNPLLHSYKGADGLKTGWTQASGHNIIATARRGKTRLIAVILGASGNDVRAREIRRLLDAGFAVTSGKASSAAAALGVKR